MCVAPFLGLGQFSLGLRVSRLVVCVWGWGKYKMIPGKHSVALKASPTLLLFLPVPCPFAKILQISNEPCCLWHFEYSHICGYTTLSFKDKVLTLLCFRSQGECPAKEEPPSGGGRVWES